MTPVAFVSFGLVAIVFAGVIAFFIARSRRQARDASKLEATPESRRIPPSLHPVIDPDICIGSLSCITACPEGDILGVVNGAAKLIVGSNCIGHGRCSIECPVDAIKLVFGTAERGVDLPEVSAVFESSRAGVHIVGELAGMGLIKNAMTQGLQLAEHFARAHKNAINDDAPVVIVGAGPAGIATAVGLQARGVPYRLLEQSSVGGTTAHYPRQKIVMTERIQLPGFGAFGKSQISKEALSDLWQKVLAKTGLRVEEGVKVDGVSGDDGGFLVQSSAGEVRAAKVVLAIGRRGSPRKLGVPGEHVGKVTYSLIDPEQYAQQRVLVVGGGDSALEAALAIADQPGADVTISYRGADFGKCRDQNRARIKQAIESGKVKAHLPSTVEQVEETAVTLKIGERTEKLGNDYVIACLGGELPIPFLGALGIGMTRHHGDKVIAPAHQRTGERPSQLGWIFTCIGIGIVTMLAIVGWKYYLLSPAERLRSQMHEALRPAGVWGHGIGIGATLFMLLNFLYPLRKRTRVLKGTAPIKSWLTFHVFVGIMSPIIIAFHAAFHSRNLLATATFVALLIVATTGLVGRFIYAFAPRRADRTLDLAEVQGQLERARRAFFQLGDAAKNAPELKHAEAQIDEARFKKGSMLGHLIGFRLATRRLREDLGKLRGSFTDGHAYEDFVAAAVSVQRLQLQAHFFRGLKRLLSGWRAFHVVLALFLVLIIAVHVTLSIYLGYTWVF
ncbi:MAG: NAD(P)-binding domain-containing protein [Deltaproteobacteria bacterium]|nr:NAD(P)-binding domain-containing protein [Deltaproteobacteria bacterium]